MEKKTALVISGGGSKGAFGGGVAQYLIEEGGRDYDLFIGTSTGSLLVPFLAINEINKLREAYTNVTQEDIFKVNPFKVKKDVNGSTKVGINYLNVLWNVTLRGKNSFGDASNLRNLINTFMTERDFEIIKNSNKEVLSCVTNLTLAQTEFKSTNEYGWKDYGDWMLASSTVPPFMEYVTKGGYDYADGGLLENIPIQEAINRGATDIDVIILKKEHGSLAPERIRNPFHYLLRSIDLMMTEIGRDDIRLANLNAKIHGDVKINFYYTPRKLTNNSLVFNKEAMNDWWKEGYESAKLQYCKTYELIGKRKPKLIFNGMKKDTTVVSTEIRENIKKND
jgi:predicted patatin/cPLA2 family phospholipase